MAKTDVRPRMLLVDDDAYILDALKRNLQRDFHVIAMDSGWDALQELSENENVDVIITDLHMPHMSGGQLLDWMADLFPDVPRIVFTGDTAPAELDGILRAVEVYDALYKPVDSDTIRDSALAAIAHARGRKGGVPATASL